MEERLTHFSEDQLQLIFDLHRDMAEKKYHQEQMEIRIGELYDQLSWFTTERNCSCVVDSSPTPWQRECTWRMMTSQLCFMNFPYGSVSSFFFFSLFQLIDNILCWNISNFGHSGNFFETQVLVSELVSFVGSSMASRQWLCTGLISVNRR
jgi:hypothetical protein